MRNQEEIKFKLQKRVKRRTCVKGVGAHTSTHPRNPLTTPLHPPPLFPYGPDSATATISTNLFLLIAMTPNCANALSKQGQSL